MQNSSRSFIAVDVSKIRAASFDYGCTYLWVSVDFGFLQKQEKAYDKKRKGLMNKYCGDTTPPSLSLSLSLSLEDRVCYMILVLLFQACGAAFNEKTPAYLLLPACLEMRLVSADCFSNGFGQQC